VTVAANRWKLGLFVIAGLGVALASLVALGARSWNDETIDFVSYFDESVQGLELGSPVKFRGVTVGRVADVDIASDLRHVVVRSELVVEQVGRLNLGNASDGRPKFENIHPELRVQLAQTGITGVKFLLIDFFDPTTHPIVPLPFKPPPNYIPTAASTMKNLEDSVVRAAGRFSEIADETARTVAQVRVVVEQLQAGELPGKASNTLDTANIAIVEFHTQLKAMNMAGLSTEAQKNLAEFNALLVRTNALLTRLDGDGGLLHSAERGADAINDVARGAGTLGPELELTLREVRGAARSIKHLADAIERDPDMLIKGRARASNP
jgi:paraquat-inducible protein B